MPAGLLTYDSLKKTLAFNWNSGPNSPPLRDPVDEDWADGAPVVEGPGGEAGNGAAEGLLSAVEFAGGGVWAYAPPAPDNRVTTAEDSKRRLRRVIQAVDILCPGNAQAAQVKY
jgi:hypothetical protein